MRVRVLKDVKTPKGIIEGGKIAKADAILPNGDVILTYNTVCCYGTIRLKKGDYEIIRKESV